MRSTAQGVALLLVVPLLALAACETTPQAPPGPAPGDSARRVLLLPLNVVSSMASELEPGAAPVWGELRGFLEAHGKQVESLDLPEARRRWLASIRTVQESGAEAGFESAARVLATDLAGSHDFDCLVVPSLVLRAGRLSRRNATWDGVKHKVEFLNPPRRAGSLQIRADLSGSIPAASLHLVVVDPAGERLHEEMAGLVVLQHFRAEADERYSFGRWRMETRPDAFASAEVLRDGVERAFDPYLLAPPGPR